MMNDLPDVVSRDEWFAARRELLAREKELTRARDVLNPARRRMPMVRIAKEYIFDGLDGPATLLDLFDGRQQLVMHHFMFGPDWDQPCPSCSSAADGFGNLRQLHVRNTTLVAVSRLGRQEAWEEPTGRATSLGLHVGGPAMRLPDEYET